MAVAAATVWEIRPTNGVDTNGGGFVAGATGTDWSQQNAAQYALTSVASGGAGNTVNSASAAADMVGNIAQCTAGTNFNTGFFQVTSISAGVSITFSTNAAGQSICSGIGVGGVINIGGAVKTVPVVEAARAQSNKIFVKAESTISTTATIAINGTQINPPTATAPWTRYIGYTSSRGDNGRVSVALSTNTGLTAFAITTIGVSIENFDIDCASLGTSTGISTTVSNCRIINNKVKNFTTAGIKTANGQCIVYGNELTLGTSAATAGIQCTTNSATLMWNYIHDNSCPGINTGSGSGVYAIIGYNLITNNTGASSDGVITNNMPLIFLHNTIYGSGRDGLHLTSTSGLVGGIIKGNIFAKNGAWGFNGVTAAWAADVMWDGNGYWNNTSGNRQDLDDTTTNKQNNVAPYTNSIDVAITSSAGSNNPFTNDAGGDFTLNNTAGAGALWRGTAPPGAITGATGTGHADFGVFQHQDPVGGSSGFFIQ